MVAVVSTFLALLCATITVDAGCHHQASSNEPENVVENNAETAATTLTETTANVQTCVGDAVSFILPADPTEVMNCCTPPQKVTWLDEASKIGQCCDESQVWSGDQVTGVGGCCDADKHWSQDEGSGLGRCCPPYHEFAGDKASGNGACCPNPLRWSGGRCVRPPPTQFRAQASAGEL